MKVFIEKNENEKVKNKIIEIINDGILHGEDNFGIPTYETIETIANLLIDSGIISDVNIQDLIDNTCGVYMQGIGLLQLYKVNEVDELKYNLEIEKRISNKAISLLEESVDTLCIENVVNCETCPAYDYCGGEGPQAMKGKWRTLLKEQAKKEAIGIGKNENK